MTNRLADAPQLIPCCFARAGLAEPAFRRVQVTDRRGRQVYPARRDGSAAMLLSVLPLGRTAIFIAIEAVQPRFDFIFVQDLTIAEFPPGFLKQRPFMS